MAYDVASASDTNQATGGIFREAKDQYMSPIYFMELTNPMLLLGFDTPKTTSSSVFQFGTGMTLFGPFYGGLYYKGGNTVIGNAGSSQSIIQSDTDTLLVNTGGVLVGKSRLATTTIDYINKKSNNLSAIFGITLDPTMAIGVYLQSIYNDTSEYGTWDPTTFSSTPTVATSSTTTVTDTAGTVVSSIGTEYGLGSKTSTTWTEYLLGGLRMDLGGMTLLSTLGLTYSMIGSAYTGSYETKTIYAGAGYAAYTPTTALPGATAAAISDCKSYTYYDANNGSGYMNLAPTISANVELPLDFLPYNPVLTAGLGYTFVWRMYSSSYRDLAGTAITLSGTSSDSYKVDYSTVMNGTYTKTTAAVTRSYWADATATYTNTIAPVFKVVFAPDANFSFGISYEPSFEFYGDSHSVTSGNVKTTTYEDGDGLNGNTTAGADPDDYVQTYTYTGSPYTKATDRFTFANVLKTGAKFFLIPERFRVNLGATISDTTIERTTTTTTYTGVASSQTSTSYNGAAAVVTGNDVTAALSADTKTTWDYGVAPEVAYKAGFTFFFSDAMFLDFIMSAASGGDIWNTANYALEMTIRFPPAAGTAEPAKTAEKEVK